jgi:hypothetical protein
VPDLAIIPMLLALALVVWGWLARGSNALHQVVSLPEFGLFPAMLLTVDAFSAWRRPADLVTARPSRAPPTTNPGQSSVRNRWVCLSR